MFVVFVYGNFLTLDEQTFYTSALQKINDKDTYKDETAD